MLKTGFYNDVAISSNDLNKMFSGIFTDGCVENAGDISGQPFFSTISGFVLSVNSGHCIIDGKWAIFDSNSPVTCDASGLIKSSGESYVIFYLYVDPSIRSISVGASLYENMEDPTIPAYQRTDHKIPIFWGKVTKSQGQTKTAFDTSGSLTSSTNYLNYISRIKEGMGETPIRNDKFYDFGGTLVVEGDVTQSQNKGLYTSGIIYIYGIDRIPSNAGGWGAYGTELPTNNNAVGRLFFKEE